MDQRIQSLELKLQQIMQIFGERYSGLIAGEAETITDPELKPVELIVGKIHAPQ